MLRFHHFKSAARDLHHRNLVHYILTLVVAVFVYTTLVIPLFVSFGIYRQYNSIPKDSGYANATMRKIEYKKPLFGIFGTCYEAIRYEYTIGGKIINGHDNLDCQHGHKLVLGNTLAVYYDKNEPETSISQFTLATTAGDVLQHAIPGVVGSIVILVVYTFVEISQPHWLGRGPRKGRAANVELPRRKQ